MKKKLLVFLCVAAMAAVTLFAVSCGNKENAEPTEPTQYTVTYSGTDMAATTLDEGATITKPSDIPSPEALVYKVVFK